MTLQEEKSAIVVGAGIIGVCTAWHLRRKGFSVTIIDKKKPGEETSWGNLGLLVHTRPSGFPRGALNRMRIALGQKTDTRVNWYALIQYFPAVIQYWWNTTRNYDRICQEFSTLVRTCTEEHGVMLKAAGAEHLVKRCGFIEYFRTTFKSELESIANKERSLGVKADVLSPQDIRNMEPSLCVDGLSGGLYFSESWIVVDPSALVKTYAKNFCASGGRIIEATVLNIHRSEPLSDAAKWVVSTSTGDYEAPVVVIAAGPWSQELLQPLGYTFPLFPLRGYNTHYNLADGAALNHTLVDADKGFGISPMIYGARLTTGGELTMLSSAPNRYQLDADEALAREVVPIAERCTDIWFGHRPCLPDMKPIISEAPNHKGLWLCFGHGTGGLTLGAVSGRLISELINSEKPFIDPTPFSSSRFL